MKHRSFIRKAALAVASMGLVLTAQANDSSPAATRPAAAKQWWSYQPVQRPEVPQVANETWVRDPIDAFVLAKLEEKKLAPSSDADRATFIRRATLDTWGLIPNPEDVRRFVNDRSPRAYEKLVDRLLASPKYGERWGRRWLDLARYADSDGYNADGTRPHIWRYRDYVIDAFNSDKPYDRFIKEQLAGDELWPDDLTAHTATGFLRSYPDEINARDLNLKKQEIATDLTDTVGAVFLAATVGCAKCHDHKFDKISQREYFQMQAFFVNASARDDLLPLQGKELERYQIQKAKYDAETADIRAKMDALIQPTIDKLEEDRILGFTPGTRESITKSEAQRTPYDRWVYDRSLWTMVGRTRNAENRMKEKDKESYAQYQALKDQLKAFDSLKPQEPGYISAMRELGPDSPPTNILANGIYDRLLEEVQPGLPAAIAPIALDIKPTNTSSGRRTALAEWIASPDNPLTARVFVNRVWNQYFGHGIVDTVSDFGRMGEKPLNPALLDYLAHSFVHDDQWSIKRLQRRIMLSSVYRQSSVSRPDAHAVDPNNRLLALFPRQRLDAEQIRDSLLAASGLLLDKLGGPAVFPPVPANFNVRPNQWTTSLNPHDHHRRSVYVFTRRNVAYPLFETFDMANPNNVHSKRDVTTTAPQALALINSDLIYEWSRSLAGRIVKEAGKDESKQIDRLYQVLFSRSPDESEQKLLLSFWGNHEKLTQTQLAQGKKVATPDGFGLKPAVNTNVDKLYQSIYGRSADRFERAALVQFIEQREQQLAQASTGEGDAASTNSQPTDASGTTARAAAFVDLVHAVANSNDFSYRF